MQQNYDVIRFVQQNGKYHVVMDYVEGEILCNFLRKTHTIDKHLAFQFILLIAKELNCLQKSKAEEMYPCLTPLHIIVKKDKTIAFLKTSEKYNQQVVEKINLFMPADGVRDYIYSYGKTIQFLLSNMECVPDLTWKEERKFKAIISKCLNYKSKKRYRNGQDIVNQLNPKRKKKIIYLFPITALLILAIGSLGIARKDEQPIEAIEPQKSSYELLREYLDGDTVESKEHMEKVINDYKLSLGDQLSVAQMEFLFQVYCCLDNDYGKEQAMDIATDMFESLANYREIIANIHLEQNHLEEAIREFELVINESPSVERYLCLVNLLEQNGRQKEAMNLCEEGCRFDSEGSELQLQYVRLLLLGSEYSINDKQDKLGEFLALYPAIEELPKFQEIKKQTNFEEVHDEN